MKKLISMCACATTLAVVLAADADEYVFHPGSECVLYSGTASNDVFFSRAVNNGMLLNVSGAPAKAMCPLGWDKFAAPNGTVSSWEIDARGTTGWDISKCGLFGQKWNTGRAFPSSLTELTPNGDSVNISGQSNSTVYMGGGQLEIICTVPAAAQIIHYEVMTF